MFCHEDNQLDMVSNNQNMTGSPKCFLYEKLSGLVCKRGQEHGKKN